ncbi:MAG: hypothetical protein ACRC8N_15760 [Aeromonas veronii]
MTTGSSEKSAVGDLKEARNKFEAYIGWKPVRLRDGTDGDPCYDPAIEGRWKDFLHGYMAAQAPAQPQPAPVMLNDSQILELAKGINFTYEETRQFYEDSYQTTVRDDTEVIKFARRILAATNRGQS